MNQKIDNPRLNITNHYHVNYQDSLAEEVMFGLQQKQKKLSSKYFYDHEGSKLFEEICNLDEYYVTRTELSLLEGIAGKLMASFTSGDIVELGSGANWKIRKLLDQIDPDHQHKFRYIPVDVSSSALITAADELLDIYPNLNIHGIVADFTRDLDKIPYERPRTFLFFGSSVGNFTLEERRTFMEQIAKCMNQQDRFFLAVDMIKPVDILETAYNDNKGVTAAFNKNILMVVNRELEGDLDLDHFEHFAFFNPDHSRIEMHLKAKKNVSATFKRIGLKFEMDKGETIHTENCHKFDHDQVEQMIAGTDLIVSDWFSDEKNWFSLIELKLEGEKV